jgi:nucleoside-diphosphate-sugar epimerase
MTGRDLHAHSPAGTIVGSGLIARAFAVHAKRLKDVCIYAAGVSNSSCTDPREFARERDRLTKVLREGDAAAMIVYFSTCSVGDANAHGNAYVRHKLDMEELVHKNPRNLVLRLPQLAGVTPNPHTLLNYLVARIARSERFEVWSGAKRNIIDVDDVARIALDLIEAEGAAGEIINIANPRSHGLIEIVRTIEEVLDHRALYDLLDRESSYVIDTRRIAGAVERSGVAFTPSYLRDVIHKYHGRHD